LPYLLQPGPFFSAVPAFRGGWIPMNNSFWRLAALSGVVGLGLLVVFQAQQGLDLNTLGRAFGVKDGSDDGAEADRGTKPNDNGADGLAVGDQSEPMLGPETITRVDAGDEAAPNSDDPFATADAGSIRTASNAAVSRRPIQTGGVDFRQIENEDMNLDDEPPQAAPIRRAAPLLTADDSGSFTARDDEAPLVAPALRNTDVSDDEPRPAGIRLEPGRKVVGLFDDEPERSSAPAGTASTLNRDRPSLDETEPAAIEVSPATKSAPRLMADDAPTAAPTVRWTSPGGASGGSGRTLTAPRSPFLDDEPLTSDETTSPKIRLAQSDEPSPEPASADERPASKRPAPVAKPADVDDEAAFPDSARPAAAPATASPPNTLRLDADERIERQPAANRGAGESPPPRSDSIDGDTGAITTTPRGQQRPQLSIDKVAPQAAVLGQPMVYTIRVRNVGSIPAHQVVVEDRVPRGVQLDGTNPRAEMSEKTKTLIWKLGTLESGQERTISVRVVPTTEGAIGSVATVNFSTSCRRRRCGLNCSRPNGPRLVSRCRLRFA
jgi:uncharacterized repeat protein (TIGR01451 family)